MLMAANRVGKTFGEGREFAIHATGLYPDDWVGFKFINPPQRMWALGVTGEQIRDVIQKELCGDVGPARLNVSLTHPSLGQARHEGCLKILR